MLFAVFSGMLQRPMSSLWKHKHFSNPVKRTVLVLHSTNPLCNHNKQARRQSYRSPLWLHNLVVSLLSVNWLSYCLDLFMLVLWSLVWARNHRQEITSSFALLINTPFQDLAAHPAMRLNLLSVALCLFLPAVKLLINLVIPPCCREDVCDCLLSSDTSHSWWPPFQRQAQNGVKLCCPCNTDLLNM